MRKALILFSFILFIKNDVVALESLGYLVFQGDTVDISKVGSIVYNVPIQHTYTLKKLVAYLSSFANNDFEKAFLFYCYIGETIQYDKPKEKRMFWHRHRLYRIMYTQEILSMKRGICGDISYLFKAMCDESNIPCEIVKGYAGFSLLGLFRNKQQPNHAWNIVQIHNKWYPIDATWCTHLYKKKRRHKLHMDYYAYFLSDTTFFNNSHLPADPIWQLKKQPISWSYYKWGFLSSKKHLYSDNYNFNDSINKRMKMNPADGFIESACSAFDYNPKNKLIFINMLFLPTKDCLDIRRKNKRRLTIDDYYEEQKLYASLIEYCRNKKKGMYISMGKYFEKEKEKIDKHIEMSEKK